MSRPKGTISPQTMERVNLVMTMITNGAKHSEIVQYGARTWNVKARQVGKYVTYARQAFAGAAEIDRAEQRGIAAARYNHLFREMVRLQDFKGAVAAQRELCKLLGLDEPTQLDIAGRLDFAQACATADELFKTRKAQLRDEIVGPAGGGPAGEKEGS